MLVPTIGVVFAVLLPLRQAVLQWHGQAVSMFGHEVMQSERGSVPFTASRLSAIPSFIIFCRFVQGESYFHVSLERK